jgi:hypothetical protein
MSPSPVRRWLATLLYIVMTAAIVFMIYTMVKGDTNWRYGAIAIVIAMLAKAAERLNDSA